MSNAKLVSLSSSDLETVAGGGSLLPANRVGSVLSTLGHTEESIAAVARANGLTPGAVFANGAVKGIEKVGELRRLMFGW